MQTGAIRSERKTEKEGEKILMERRQYRVSAQFQLYKLTRFLRLHDNIPISYRRSKCTKTFATFESKNNVNYNFTRKGSVVGLIRNLIK